MRVGIIGGGRWGCTLGNNISSDENPVTIYCRQEDYKNLQKDRRIPYTRFFLDPNIDLCGNISGIGTQQVIFITVPGNNLEECVRDWGSYLRGIVVVAVKSIAFANGVLVLPLNHFKDFNSIYFACGAFPEGILDSSPAIGTLYGAEELCQRVRPIIPKDKIRTYISSDTIGGQIGSALKNVIALACGIAQGLYLDEMTKAAIVSRGLREMVHFALSHGADKETFEPGSSVLADLIGTCFSPNSHNFKAGITIATSNRELLRDHGTVEGIGTVCALNELGYLDEMPISAAVYSIIFNNIDPKKAILSLLNRPLN